MYTSQRFNFTRTEHATQQVIYGLHECSMQWPNCLATLKKKKKKCRYYGSRTRPVELGQNIPVVYCTEQYFYC